jgi:hypothetical protein
LLLDPPRPHHDYFVGEPSRLGQIVRHQERCHREIAAHCIEGFLKIGAGDRIERAKGLVKENHARSGGDTPRESHTLALTARELVRKAIAELRRRQTDEIEGLFGRVFCIGHLAEHRYQRDVTKYPPVWEKAPVLLDVSDSSAQQNGWLSANILIADFYVSTQRLDESVEASKQRGLPRPALAYERDGASGWNIDAHVIERDNGPEAM